MQRKKLVLAVALVCGCGGGSDTATDAASTDAVRIDAPGVMPMITSFVASPATVAAGTPTDVTWNWTYAAEPTIPDPTCMIDNAVGPLTRGDTTSVTLTSVTTFTLMCTNTQGTAARQVVVAVPPAAPIIATFTATPPTIPIGAATSVTWAWTYSNSPSPPPVCTIDGVGTVTSGGATSLTQTTSRGYRLRCTNSVGTSAAVTNVNVDECAANTDDCQANASCTDTADGFTCACNGGYTGNGDVCSVQAACGVTPTLCDPNATCTNGTSCVCNPTFVGDGTTCTRNRIAFTTSTIGSGQLSTWVGAGGNAGLAAADAVCTARATAAGLPGTYVAWMSSSLDDAYCRVHGLTGKKATSCGQASLPVAAGPWVRPDGRPFAPAIDRLLAPNRTLYQPASVNESGVDLALTERIYTGTDDNGVLTAAATCNDWTSSSSLVVGTMGEAHGGGGGSWTDVGVTDPACSSSGHLRCMQTTSGPALPSRHPVAKKAFLSSVSGTGNMSTWVDAGGLTGVAAADAVCQARARFAGYANSSVFKAWMSTSSSSATTRIVTNGPWARPDGVVIGISEADLIDGRLGAALYLTETGTYVQGATDVGNVWTGTSSTGVLTSSTCTSWTSTVTSGTLGRHDTLDIRWTAAITAVCSADQRIFCLED